MASAVSAEELGRAIVASARTGELPEDQDIVVARLDSKTLPAVRKQVDAARRSLEDEVKKISSKSAGNVDSWIKQARQIEQDLERSKVLAKEVVRQAEETKAIDAKTEDAQHKVELLRKEARFNEQLKASLEKVQIAHRCLVEASSLARNGDVSASLSKLDQVNQTLESLGHIQSTNAVRLLTARSRALVDDLTDTCGSQWQELLSVDRSKNRLYLKRDASLDVVVRNSQSLGLFDASVSDLAGEVLLILQKSTDDIHRLITDDAGLHLRAMKNVSYADTVSDLTAATTALHERLPLAIATPLADKIMPDVVQSLATDCLTASLPTDVNNPQRLKDVIATAEALADHLAELGWPGGAELGDWTESIPRHWLARKRESSLAVVRIALSQSLRKHKTVERVETQLVEADELLSPNPAEHTAAAEDWNDKWDEQPVSPAQARHEPLVAATKEEGEDTSAWDDAWDEDGTSVEVSKPQVPAETDAEEDAQAWDAWDSGSPPPSPQRTRATAAPETNGHVNSTTDGTHKKGGPREVTLRETYTTTQIPDELMSTIQRLGEDAVFLQTETDLPISPAAVGLFSIPTLVLAAFRSLASSHYQQLQGGSMFLYNDAVYLSDSLSRAIRDEPEWLSNRMKLDTEVATLDSFSRRTYGKEMESQRTILRDLLDGAQGFTSCNEEPFKSASTDSVAATVDRIVGISQEWRPILSQSALLQSLGSLVSTVVNKMILDIQELSDIGEQESRHLRSLFDKVSSLDRLFTSSDNEQNEQATIGLYTPEWFKFQYLAELLDSSLADIKYLWTEGELSLEFSADEVVDLIEALFAESDHRRRAIADIRRR